MRAAISFVSSLVVTLAPSALSQPQQNNASDEKPTYFLVDSSGSMGDRLADGSIPRNHADAVLARELNKFVEANPDRKASVNFYGANSKTCDAGEVKVSPQQAIPEQLPKSPEPNGATNLGAWLEAALKDAGDREARIVIVSDGGQSDRCGFDVCTIAGERLSNSSRVVVEQYWAFAGNGTLPPFPCIDTALKKERLVPLVAGNGSQTPTPASEAESSGGKTGGREGSADNSAVTFQNSYPWALLAILFAMSFIMLGNSFADAHRKLDARFQTLSKDAETGDYVNFSALRPKTHWAMIVFAGAIVLSLSVLWGPKEYVGFARLGAANALNSEFGAAVFLAGLMTLGVFASSQYWRYSELRRTYRLASNEADRFEKAKAEEADRRRRAKLEEAEQQRKAKAEREIERLAQQYDVYRARFSDRDYGIEKHLSKGPLLTANAEILEQVIGSMKFLAAGPPPPRDRISANDVEQLGRLTGFGAGHSAQALIGFIPNARLPEPIRKHLRDFFYPDQTQDSDKQNSDLKALKKELDLLVTQHSAGSA